MLLPPAGREVQIAAPGATDRRVGAGEPVDHPLRPGLTIEFGPMRKELA